MLTLGVHCLFGSGSSLVYMAPCSSIVILHFKIVIETNFTLPIQLIDLQRFETYF